MRVQGLRRVFVSCGGSHAGGIVPRHGDLVRVAEGNSLSGGLTAEGTAIEVRDDWFGQTDVAVMMAFARGGRGTHGVLCAPAWPWDLSVFADALHADFDTGPDRGGRMSRTPARP